ncbi:hypothetical protein HYH03_001826 [Edaphochlamys debaryana]|uniref:Uncharacterized protein n=1 Tax=Edaphochlamys debaryana TaxID=47281 RepID=A0A836C5P1_9CHLO|nr:hypothetical protein HYH03_001826 [Edaphochlamys debaryana]|eukprot:KAG2500248.1 hypothetical protein HYH03_001826 [Edaphochlamys debaryana]
MSSFQALRTRVGCNRPAVPHRRHTLLHAKPALAEPVTTTAPAAAAANGETATPSTATSRAPRARFRANKLGRQPIYEAQRPLGEYMALPASQYSVLDARKIERVDDTTFKCYVGALKLFSWSAEPVITVSVTVEEGGCTIRLLGCRLQGSRFVEDLNEKFSATMTNVVRYRDYVAPEGQDEPAPAEEAAEGRRLQEIVSDTTIEVDLEIPSWCAFLGADSISASGSKVMQGVLNAMVPRFLAQLRTDYEKWAAGDDSRKPVGEI